MIFSEKFQFDLILSILVQTFLLMHLVNVFFRQETATMCRSRPSSVLAGTLFCTEQLSDLVLLLWRLQLWIPAVHHKNVSYILPTFTGQLHIHSISLHS